MDNSVLKFADLIGSDETFDQILANIRLIKKELKDLAKVANQNLASINPNDEKAIEAAIKDVNELTKAKKVLEEQERTTLKTKKKLNELTEEELILREKQKIENRERVQRAKQLAILQRAEIGSIEALRAELSLTTLQWKKLGDAERQSTKEGKELVKEKKRLTEQLKRLEKQTGDTRRNVGNYTDSLGRLGRTAARIFVGRSIVDGIKRIGSALVSITQDGAGVSKELANIQKRHLDRQSPR
jgi:DNA repair exonuclease SbcCD ATPase subunit